MGPYGPQPGPGPNPERALTRIGPQPGLGPNPARAHMGDSQALKSLLASLSI